MPFTTVSIALNTVAGVAVWLSDISLAAKIVITVLLVAKCALFFTPHGCLKANDSGRLVFRFVSLPMLR